MNAYRTGKRSRCGLDFFNGGLCSLFTSFYSVPLTDFTILIVTYPAEISDILIFIGQICAFIVLLSGAILWFTDTNSGKGKELVLSGVLLAIVVEYFVLFPPDHVII